MQKAHVTAFAIALVIHTHTCTYMYLRMVQNDRTNEDGAHMSGLHMIYTKRDLLRETLYETPPGY